MTITLLTGCGPESAASLNPSFTSAAPATSSSQCFDSARPAAKNIHGSGAVFVLTKSGSLKVLHSFGGSADGAYPYAGLIEVNGTLYGTTQGGGANGGGTVFAISPSGAESVLHSFGSSGDGKSPVASLIYLNGALYGTTEIGGAYGCGTVFSITPSGTETVLHSFAGYPSDGGIPTANLLDVDGTLYGTTYVGGSGSCEGFIGHYAGEGCGAVFEITTAGEETLLYHFVTFTGPYAGLVDLKGTLYGTSVVGSIYRVTMSGDEGQIYSFDRETYGGLTDVNGTLYGTTYNGGTNCGSKGCGLVFSMKPSFKITVLHSFGGPGDGKHPSANLVNVNGTLYGTTYAGGATGRGTLFTISTSGSEKVIHTFGRTPNGGKYPFAPLLNFNGNLYGTTLYGGDD
ncbi:MAG TPA: choice-of-anchor tandem repeat GloVer-containing protein [Candidatus Cybelea sp.]|nr:choice-of-anchor tandem repeat GloVer-containing protein [Candidatus Cybelea sp.]